MPLVSAAMAGVCVCVIASLKGTHTGVQTRKPTLQDCLLGTGQRQLKSNEIPRALARTMGEVTEPQGQEETLQTRMEKTGQTLVCGPRSILY